MTTPASANRIPGRGGRRLVRSALEGHLRVPLYREGYALVVNQAVISLLGVVYWLIAARQYAPHVVGLNSAAISAMMFLAGVSQLNMMYALMRFVPVAGRKSTRFVLSSYLLSVTIAAAATLVFLWGIEIWAPALGFLAGSPWFILSFTAATMAWCVFNLQDSVLTSLRAALFVPLENLVYSIAKIALLVAFAAASWRYGIFASWTVGLTASLVGVNILIFRRLLPRHVERADDRLRAPTRREVARFVSADFLSSVFWLGATTLMPLVVVALEGATANAYFSLAWMIALPLFAIPTATGQSLLVSGSRDEAALPVYARRVLLQTSAMVIPLAVGLVVAAQLVLSIFGAAYARESATTLAFLSLAAIPHVVTFLYVSIYRVRRRMLAVVSVLGSLCGLAVLIGVVLLQMLGIAGVGLGWLIAEALVAVTLLVSDRRALRLAQ
jgi:O-antigen/teichoic acid export membrane protein